MSPGPPTLKIWHTMFPRHWTVTIESKTVVVVAGTREAAEKIAARRLANGKL
jgi:hypothetical protein